MKGLEIPPRYKAYLFRAFDTSPISPGDFYRIVFAFDLLHAQTFMRDFLLGQGSDLNFHFIAEVSLSDVDVLPSEYNSFQCVLGL